MKSAEEIHQDTVATLADVIKKMYQLLVGIGPEKMYEVFIKELVPMIKKFKVDETQSVTNEGASTATLEELEEKANEIIDVYSKSTLEEFWSKLKPNLSALLKEKDEKIDGYKALVQKYLDETTSNPIKDKLLQQQKQIQELQSQLKEKEAEIERLNKALDQSCTDLNQWDGFQPSSTV